MIGNVVLLGAWQLLTLVAVPKEQIRRNTEENLRALRTGKRKAVNAGLRIEPGMYIENQPQLGGLKFGNRYDFAYGGCSVIAVYNTWLSLGEQMSGEALCEIAEELQRRGVALGGKFGVAPLSLKHYFKRYSKQKGFTVKSTCSNRTEVLDALGTESDAILVVLWNGKRLRNQFHAMHIEKRSGEFIIHNACYLLPNRNDEVKAENKTKGKTASHGSPSYGERGPFGSLSEAISGYSAGGAGVALAIGIKRQ